LIKILMQPLLEQAEGLEEESDGNDQQTRHLDSVSDVCLSE